MPYIDKRSRSKLWSLTFQMSKDVRTVNKVGELNYLISTLLDEYIADKGLSYTTINELMGVLECVKQEFYRRVAAPYEDEKIKENGDVYFV